MGKRRVDFKNNAADLQAAVLASMGFSTTFIASKTHLSSGQVLYRLRLAGIKRADYRNGVGPAAQIVMRHGGDVLYDKVSVVLRNLKK